MSGNLHRIIGPFVTILLIAIALVALWFYYCHYKPRKQKKKKKERGCSVKHKTRELNRSRYYDDEVYYGMYTDFHCSALCGDAFTNCSAMMGDFRTLEFPANKDINWPTAKEQRMGFNVAPISKCVAQQQKQDSLCPPRLSHPCDILVANHHHCETIEEGDEEEINEIGK